MPRLSGISHLNHDKAVEHFKSTGEWFPGCVLHHMDKTLRNNDPERYHQWRVEDLQVLTRSQHSIIHNSEEERANRSIKQIGKFVSEETRTKLSKAAKGRRLTEEQKKHLSEINKGKKLSEETRAKISKSQKGVSKPGHPHSKEWCENHSKQMMGENNPMYGKSAYANKTEEEMAIISKKMSDARRGKHWKLVDGKRVWYE